MPEKEQGKWEGLSRGLSDYYNSPGRLATFRRQFERATRRPGMDPATFATELEILAVRGFGDMGKRARDWMIRDRFIAAQWSCGLRRHLDGVSSDTPIRDIVDGCRLWESHSEQEPSSGVGLDKDPLGGSGDSRELGCLRVDSQELMVCPVMDSRVPVPVVSVIPRNVETQRKVGNGDSQLAPLEVISSLVTRLLRTAQEGRLVDVKVPLEEWMGSSSAATAVVGAEKDHSVRERARVCFSCGYLLFHSYCRAGRWMSGMTNIEQYRLVQLECGLLREMRDGPSGRVSLPDRLRPRYN